VALSAVAWHAVWLGLYAGLYGGLDSLACVGEERAGRPPYEAVRPLPFAAGYDGQFCYALARAPFRRHDAGIDAPAPRQLRVLYPALAWALTGGDKHALLWALPLVNLLAVGGLAWLGALAAHDGGLSPWWGLLLPVAVNALQPAFRDLTDAVSTCCVAALLVAWLRGAGPPLLFVAAAAALFCRETNVLAVAAVGVAALRRRRWGAAAALTAAGLCWGSWFVHVWRLYGEVPLLPGAGNLAPPLAGLAYAAAHLGAADGWSLAANVVSILALLIQFALLAWAAWRLRPETAVLLAGLAFAGLALCGGVAIYEDRWSYLRVYAALPLAVWLACARAGRRGPLLALALPLLLGPLTVLAVWPR
jgi:hypothetical protein